MTIRPAVSADLPGVRDLFREYVGSVETDLCFQGFDTELSGLPGAYQPPAGALLVAEVDGALVGSVALRPLEPPAVAEMKRLYVRPAGRGHGLGAALVSAVLGCARAAGYRQVRLDTLPSMVAAQELYRRLGFRDIPPYRDHPVPGARFMELDLTAPPHHGFAPTARSRS